MSENKREDQAAFPVLNGFPAAWGLSKREYFAAKALHGMLANSDLVERMIQSRTAGTTMESYYAEEAIKQADALIKELEK